MLRYLLPLLLIISQSVNAAEIIQPFVVGDTIELITLKDQHGKSSNIDESTKLILFTTGMKGGKVVREAIENKGADYLAKRNISFISNISGMPGFITRTFALPRMKKLRYSIMLDREGKVTEKFPSQKKNATILHLDKLKIVSIDFTKDPDEVTQVINRLSN